MSSGVPDSAIVEVPQWLWNNAPEAFFKAAMLHARSTGAASNAWRVRPFEKHFRTAPSLLDVHHLAGPGVARQRFADLEAFPAPNLRGPVTQRELDELKKRAERASATGEVVDAFTFFSLQTSLAGHHELPQIAENIYAELLAFRMEETSAVAFPDSSVHVVRRRAELVHRIKLASFLIRIEHDPALAAGNLGPTKAAANTGSLVFSASEELINGVVFLDLYFGPLLGALSPAVWGFHTAHEVGTMLYSIGSPLSGSKGDAAEMLHLLPGKSPLVATRFSSFQPRAAREALDWWAARLNALFGVLTNPAVFSDSKQRYVPVKHIQGTSTAEQLFKRVTSILSSHRDTTARNVIFFSILDTLERMTSRNLETHCGLQFARDTLDRLERDIPLAAAEILLPAARRAVAALAELQNGFFLLQQSGATEIDILDNGQVVGSLKPERAAAEYVKVLRNATHGFGSNKSGRNGITNTLLAHHNGEIPQDLPLLGYLYLLDVLSRPEVVERSLYRGGRV
ncbi:hypothetical protein [Amycolatopsis nalaikhensis]|uniref:Uncharacterized protein n=1 Tax=Amycolatopsis nalaikhensis TaxID=715472 RepID=A0ABY8XYC1_9PSEU|nr:hypothetical protein [Amycolatopsis sp. 2-2]WIV60742.1 hypothetical protein QP939_20070 [Amycolatopsis sp. 2-2]